MDIVAWMVAPILAAGAVAYGLMGALPFASPPPKRSQNPAKAGHGSDDLPCDDRDLFA